MTTPAPVQKTWEGTILDAIIAYYESNEAALLGLAANYNGPLVTLVEGGLDALLAKEPILKLVLGGEVAALPAQLTPLLVKEEGYAGAAILSFLKGLAAKYGG